jgi:ketosteroid isomerase-like protein
MSEEDVDVVRRTWEAADRRDTDALFALYDPAIVWQSHYGPISGSYHGHDGVRQFFREWTDALETFHARAEEFIDADHCVVVDVRVWARGKGSGVEAEMPQGQLFRVRNGLVTHIELFETKERALEAAGISG